MENIHKNRFFFKTLVVNLFLFLLLSSWLISKRNDRLFWAAAKGDPRGALLELHLGANPNHFRNGKSALLIAIESGAHSTVDLLLEKGADPDLNWKNDLSPLEVAARLGDLKSVNLLFQHGASPKGRTTFLNGKYGDFILFDSAMGRCPLCFERILSEKIKKQSETNLFDVLSAIIHTRNEKLFQKIVARSSHHVSLPELKDTEGNNLLHVALNQNPTSEGILMPLLHVKICLFEKNTKGLTPLDFIQTETVPALIDNYLRKQAQQECPVGTRG